MPIKTVAKSNIRSERNDISSHEIWNFIQKLGIKFELDYRLRLTARLQVFKLFTRLLKHVVVIL